MKTAWVMAAMVAYVVVVFLLCRRIWISATLKRKLSQSEIITPGEYFEIVTTTDPWGGKRYAPVKIIDVRDGWVRYSFGGSPFSDERMRIEDFVALYVRKT
jgi:hypothetical protein